VIDPRLAWFAIGAICSALVFGWPWRPRFSRFSCRMGPPRGSYGNCVPMPPSTPAVGYRREYLYTPSTVAECGGPCEAGPEYCHCGQLWRDVPLRLDPGRVQRGNGNGGPATPKPDIIPRGTRSISFPDPGPDRQPTNPFTGDPVKPQPHGGRVIPGDTP